MRRRPSLALAIVVCATFGLTAGGCGSSERSANLRRSYVAQLSNAMGLGPAWNGSLGPTEIRVKSGAPYFVATGILPAPRDQAIATVERTLAASGWTIHDQGDEAVSLGWQLRATRGPDVIQVWVGEHAVGTAETSYVPLDGRSYVQMVLAGRDSTPDWSHLS